MADNPDNGRSATSRGSGTGRGRRDRSTGRPGAPGVAGTQGTTSGLGSTGMSSASSIGPASTISSSATVTSGSSSSSEELAKRPDLGKVGRPIELRTNTFVVQVTRDLQLHQYRIDIAADGFNRKLKRDDNYAVFWEAAKQMKLMNDPYSVLYDGGNICYSLTPLNLAIGEDTENNISVQINLPRFDDRSRFLFKIIKTGAIKIDYKAPRNRDRLVAMTVIDLVFRQRYNMPANLSDARRFHPIGRSFFRPPGQGDNTGFDLDAGRQVWCGYYFGSKLGFNFVPALNIDVANSAFLKKQSVLQYLCDVLNAAAGTNRYRMEDLERLTSPHYFKPAELQTFNKAIRGYCVCASSAPQRAQKVHCVTDRPADQLQFQIRDMSSDTPVMRTVTVAQYFIERYQKPLRYPFFPCLQIGTKRMAYLPLEVCDMYTPQRVMGKLSEKQTSDMIKGVCTDAVQREDRINAVIRMSGIADDPFAKKFGVQLNTAAIQVRGRVINPPALQYKTDRITPRDGSWMMGRSTRLFVPATITCYCVISFIGKSSERELGGFCNSLMDQAQQMGMQVHKMMPDFVYYINDASEVADAMDGVMTDCAKSGKTCDLIIVPMYAKNTENYAVVKSVAEKKVGVPTQVVIQRNIRQPKPQTNANIVLKINAKLGGINWSLVVDQVTSKYLINQPTLVLGLDVTHPGAGDKKTPSVGAAVGNLDMAQTRFGASISVQKHRREAIVYLTEAIRERVNAFFQQTQKPPMRIIVYRDGVADGQFGDILREEIQAIRLACNTVGGGGYDPKITFVVVQKRHHTRFFCSNTRDQCGRGRNVPPGTVVDTGVTHPEQFDFYLCSHFGIQGTSRPAHYHVLRDDNDFSQDELQAITYQLCHIYARCTRSVSIPAPTYYAHLACARARNHLQEIIGDGSDTLSEAGSTKAMSRTSITDSADIESEEEMKKAVKVVDSMLTKMYFC